MCAGEGLEIELARRIARGIFGADGHLEIVPLAPVSRLKALGSKSGWLNWAWRFWGTVKGYNCWSITSIREWGHAFDPNTDFGLFFVVLDHDPDVRRVPTPDVLVYGDIIRSGTAGG